MRLKDSAKKMIQRVWSRFWLHQFKQDKAKLDAVKRGRVGVERHAELLCVCRVKNAGLCIRLGSPVCLSLSSNTVHSKGFCHGYKAFRTPT